MDEITSPLQAESTHNHASKWLKVVSDWKDALPFAVSVLGILYGIGWAVQYQSVAKLGVGPISVTREAAMATALGLVYTSIPIAVFAAFLEFRHREISKPTRNDQIVTAVLSIFFYTFTAFVIILPFWLAKAEKQSISLIYYYLGIGLFIISIYLVRVVGKVRVSFYLGILMLLCVSTLAFVNFGLSAMPAFLGGQTNEDYVQIRVKEPERVIEAFLGPSDDRSLILRNATVRDPHNDEFKHWAPVFRIPVDRVIEMQLMSPPTKP